MPYLVLLKLIIAVVVVVIFDDICYRRSMAKLMKKVVAEAEKASRQVALGK